MKLRTKFEQIMPLGVAASRSVAQVQFFFNNNNHIMSIFTKCFVSFAQVKYLHFQFTWPQQFFVLKSFAVNHTTVTGNYL